MVFGAGAEQRGGIAFVVDGDKDHFCGGDFDDFFAQRSAVCDDENADGDAGAAAAFGSGVVADPVTDLDFGDEIDFAHDFGDDGASGGF